MKKIVVARCLVTLWLLMAIGFSGGCASNNGPSNDDPDPDPVTSSSARVDLFINQVNATCLPSGDAEISTYVSVIDEESNPIDALDISNFQISSNNAAIASSELTFSTTKDILPDPVSVVIIMDYSTSITDAPAIQAAMENAVLTFIDLMGPNDQAEIIKFNTGIRFIQPFTNDKSVLRTAVSTMDGVEPGATYLYDTLYYGIEDLIDQTGRMAVVAISDGKESHEWDYPGDGRTMEDVITLGSNNHVPLFLIGLGEDRDLNIPELTQMADETSGHFYRAATSNDLHNIYTSISDLLTEGQYLFKFLATPGTQANGTVSITVNYNDLSDSADATYTYPVCQ